MATKTEVKPRSFEEINDALSKELTTVRKREIQDSKVELRLQVLTEGGQTVCVFTHNCFRIPGEALAPGVYVAQAARVFPNGKDPDEILRERFRVDPPEAEREEPRRVTFEDQLLASLEAQRRELAEDRRLLHARLDDVAKQKEADRESFYRAMLESNAKTHEATMRVYEEAAKADKKRYQEGFQLLVEQMRALKSEAVGAATPEEEPDDFLSKIVDGFSPYIPTLVQLWARKQGVHLPPEAFTAETVEPVAEE